MSNNSISFYSVRDRRLSADIYLLKQYFESKMEDADFRYFIKSEISNNPKITQMVRRARQEFTRETGHAFFIDISMPKKFFKHDRDYVRMYVAEPYDFMFGTYLDYREGRLKSRKDTLCGCTHVLTGAPLVEEMVKTIYDTENLTVVGDTYLPMTWDILHSTRKDSIREKLEFYIPEVKGKKIINLLIVGACKEEELESVHYQYIRTFLDALDEECFFITNSIGFAEKLYALDSEYHDRIAYVGAIGTDNSLLYISDFLITNSGRHAVNFAGTGNPTYYFGIRECSYGKYMEEFFPELCVRTLEDLERIDFSSRELNRHEEEFYRKVVYKEKEDPFENIYSLL